MNTIKYRPVGSPNGQVVRVRVTQKFRAMYPPGAKLGERYAVTKAVADRVMARKGFVRAGARAQHKGVKP